MTRDEARAIILSFPEVTEGHSYGRPSFLAFGKFLTRLRAAGMPIRRLHEYAELRRAGLDTQERRMALIEEHRSVILQRLRELERHLALIEEPRASAKPIELRPGREAQGGFGELALESGS